MLLSPGRCPGLGAFWAFSPLQPTRRSPRSVVFCCLPCRRLVTRVACVCPAFVHSCKCCFCCFSSSAGDKREGEGEMARVAPIVWRSSFSRRRGRVARGKPWGFALPLCAGRVAGSATCADVAVRAVATSRRLAARWAVRPCRTAPWISRPACRRPGLRRYPGLRRPWWPS